MKRSYLNIKEVFGDESGNVYMKKCLVKETQPITENVVYCILQTNIGSSGKISRNKSRLSFSRLLLSWTDQLSRKAAYRNKSTKATIEVTEIIKIKGKLLNV